MVGTIRPKIVLFGSSIVQYSYSSGGWGAILADIYCRKDAAVQPSLVIVYFGGNDSIIPSCLGGNSQHVLEYTENMRKIAILLKSLSENTRIIFLTTPPVNEERLRELNWYVATYVVSVKVIDFWTAMQQADDWLNACFEFDRLHLSPGGSKVLVKEILKVIRGADWINLLSIVTTCDSSFYSPPTR